MSHSIPFIFMLFISYSFMGWAFETAACSIEARKLVDRGFLVGPLCPIYGVAALLFIFLLHGYVNDPVVLFVLITVVATILEYITSYILEKIFKVRWWDYSHLPFNLNGRIVLFNSVIFGFLGLFLIYVVNPFYVDALNLIPTATLNWIAIIVAIIFIVDIAITSKILFRIRRTTNAMIKDRTEEISSIIKNTISSQLVLTKRLLDAFPNLKTIDANKIIDQIKDYIIKTKKSS